MLRKRQLVAAERRPHYCHLNAVILDGVARDPTRPRKNTSGANRADLNGGKFKPEDIGARRSGKLPDGRLVLSSGGLASMSLAAARPAFLSIRDDAECPLFSCSD